MSNQGYDPAKPGEDETGYAKVEWIDGNPVIVPLTPAERFRLETQAEWPSAEELDRDRVFPSRFPSGYPCVPVPPDAFPRMSPKPKILQPEAIDRINEVS